MIYMYFNKPMSYLGHNSSNTPFLSLSLSLYGFGPVPVNSLFFSLPLLSSCISLLTSYTGGQWSPTNRM